MNASNASVTLVVARVTVGQSRPSRTGVDYTEATRSSAEHTARRLSVKGEKYVVMTGAAFDALRNA